LDRHNGVHSPQSWTFLDSLTLEDGTDRLSRNVCKLLPLRNMLEERKSQSI